MWIEEQESNEEEALERAWTMVQSTPSYVERFRDGRSSFALEEPPGAQIFCGACGFWAEAAHQCPPGQEVCA